MVQVKYVEVRRNFLPNLVGLCIMSRGFGSILHTCLLIGLTHSIIRNILHWLTEIPVIRVYIVYNGFRICSIAAIIHD
jgi:hypothetical protein